VSEREYAGARERESEREREREREREKRARARARERERERTLKGVFAIIRSISESLPSMRSAVPPKSSQYLYFCTSRFPRVC
jgi:hypothetical protein